MSIFDNIPREDKEPRPDGEAFFAYTNRSGRDEAERVRQNIDSWLEHYPEAHRDKLGGRLRSVSNDQHRSAFFELFLYRFLQTRGHKIISIEPKLDHTDKSPDFLAETPKQERFYVEAAMGFRLASRFLRYNLHICSAILHSASLWSMGSLLSSRAAVAFR